MILTGQLFKAKKVNRGSRANIGPRDKLAQAERKGSILDKYLGES